LLLAMDTNELIPSLALSQTDPLPRMIIDLESGNEWTFEFPFTHPFQYAQYGSAASTFSLFVLTPLRAAGGAENTIDLIFETSMRPDASFMYPLGLDFHAGGTQPNAAASGSSLTGPIMTDFRDPADIEAMCAADTCRTLRTYIKRGTLNYIDTNDLEYQFLANYPYATIPGGGAPLAPILNRICSWYALYRGSLRYTICPFYDSSNDPPQQGVYSMALTLGAPTTPDLLSIVGSTGYIQWFRNNFFQDVEVPNMAPASWRYSTTNFAATPGNFKYPVMQLPQYAAFGMLVATADDFDLAFFTGVTPAPVTPLPSAAPPRFAPRNVAKPAPLKASLPVRQPGWF